MTFLAIDIGGTKISVSLGTREGEILDSTRIRTSSFKRVADCLDWLEREVTRLCEGCSIQQSELDGIGVGVPGPIDLKRGMVLNPPNLPAWHQTPLVDLLANRFALPVAMNNDGNGWALAEYNFGACKGTQNLVIMTHSTGFGGGLILNGRLVQGASDMAGEFGHVVLDTGGPSTGGLNGTFEGYCGGGSVAREIRREVRNGANTSLSKQVGGNLECLDLQHFKVAVENNDPYALERFDAYLERLAQGIGTVLMTVNPEALILGTIARHFGDLLMVPLRKKLPKYAWQAAIDCCRIEPTQLHQISALSALAIAVDGFPVKVNLRETPLRVLV